MRKLIYICILLICCLNGFSQNDSVKTFHHEHLIEISGMGTYTHAAFGYNYRFAANDWFKVGAGMNLGGLFYKRPVTAFLILPKVFASVGKKWFWVEAGLEYNFSFNFYSIFQKDKYFNPPYTHQQETGINFSPYVGVLFVMGKKKRNELGVNYHPIFEHNKPYTYFAQHLVGIRYRFKFL